MLAHALARASATRPTEGTLSRSARPPFPAIALALALAACSAPDAARVAQLAAPTTTQVALRAAPPAPPARTTSPEAPAPSPSLAPDVAPSPAAPAHRLASRVRITRIWAKPAIDGDRFIGLLRGGQSVALRALDRVGGQGCTGRFYAIEPRGYVCDDGTVVVDPDARFDALAAAMAEQPGPFPYRYAISNGAPMYNRVPTAAEQARFERGFGAPGVFVRLHRAHAAHEELATTDPIAADATPPPFLLGPQPFGEARLDLVHRGLPLASMVSYTRAFAAEGRTWLISADQTLVPADRVRAFRPSAFHGVRLEGDAALPLAWLRARPRPQHRRLPSGAIEATGASWAARAWVGLTGASAETGTIRFLETRERAASGEGALWVAASDATVVEARTTRPTGVKPGQTWVIVSIGQGTLVAYEDLRPVYSTLISPGRGGQPQKGRDPVADATTPLGTYNVTFKDRSSTMSPDKGDERTFFIADVPHTLYFNPPFALHGAFWHERFGEPTSAGCVNLSPIDAEWVFDWSEPKLPVGWHGVTGAGAVRENGPVTAVVVVR